MPDIDTVSLTAAPLSQAPLIGNLLELYIHDLSAAFPNVTLGPDGRFGYPKLALYWSEPELRFPFLIQCGEKVAGFVLATRGSPLAEDPNVLDIAEFFVLRRYRRGGVGRRAASLLWNQLRGNWTVRVSERNPSAALFWRTAVTEFTHGAGIEFERPGEASTWRVFSFDSATGRSEVR